MKIKCDRCEKEYDEELITGNTIGYITYYFCEKCQQTLKDWVDKECDKDCSNTEKIMKGKIKDFLKK